MKTMLALLFWMLPFFVQAQVVDTAAVIRQVDSLLKVAWKSQQEAKPQEALLQLETCLAFAGKNLGKEHLRYGWVLNNLGHLLGTMGRYEPAEGFYLEALKVKQKALGKEHDDCALTMSNLANLYIDMGRFEDAEPLYLEARNIWEKTLGKAHLRYGWALNNLGYLHSSTGRFESAEPYYLEALKNKEKTLGKEHDDYALTLTNLANLYINMGRLASAEPLYLEAKNIWEKTLGKEHLRYGWALNNLGRLYMNMGHYDSAEPLLLEALKVKEALMGSEHIDYAATLINLGRLYMRMGRFESAEPLLLKTQKIRASTVGKEHPDYEICLNNLAVLYWSMGRHEDAEALFLEMNALQRGLLIKSSAYLSEPELASYAKIYERHLDQFSFAETSSATSGLIADCFDNVLFHKGFLLFAASQVMRLANSDSVSAELFSLLGSYHHRLAQQYAIPLAERDSTTLAALEAKANTLEKELVRTVAGFGEALRQVTWQQVRAQLQPGEAAIEFIHYHYYTPKPTDSIFYSALMLRPGYEHPHFIRLFEEKELKNLMDEKSVRRLEYVSKLYQPPGNGDAKSLYELIWSPLEPLLEGVKTVYCSPSGLLHRLNLGAIATFQEEGQKHNSTLADRYDLVMLGSTRQLALPPTAAAATGAAVVFGGVQYEMDSTAIAAVNAGWEDNEPVSGRGTCSLGLADSTLRGDSWKFLPETEKEVANIQSILKQVGVPAEVRKGIAATEESFKQLGNPSNHSGSPRILHISTHGYFFPDPVAQSPASSTLRDKDVPVFEISDHPMMRSGLILAGANHAWKTGKPLRPGMEDGILTAYEISQMDLSGVELVVLSACETGLCDIAGNEGVYGLQRAFKIAGAKRLIMSLWQVPDMPTQELMTAFYRNWLVEKMPVRRALRTAQQAMCAKGLEPFFWAGFVLVE